MRYTFISFFMTEHYVNEYTYSVCLSVCLSSNPSVVVVLVTTSLSAKLYAFDCIELH